MSTNSNAMPDEPERDGDELLKNRHPRLALSFVAVLMFVAAVALDWSARLPFYSFPGLDHQVHLDAYQAGSATRTLLNWTVGLAVFCAVVMLIVSATGLARFEDARTAPRGRAILLVALSLLVLGVGLIAALVAGYHMVHKPSAVKALGGSTTYGGWVLSAVFLFGAIPFVLGLLVGIGALGASIETSGDASSRAPRGRTPAPEQRESPQATTVQSIETSTTEELLKLAELHKSGALSDEEFTAAKAKLLT